MIGILDMAMGNLRSVSNAVYNVGHDYKIVHAPTDLADCTHLIIPGVGAYATAMGHLRDMKMVEPIAEFAKSGKPVLGICLGMQLLSDFGDEGGPSEGLQLIPGKIEKLDASRVPAIPHVGWNNILFKSKHPVFKSVKNNVDFYFVHSYAFACAEASDSIGETDYGQTFTTVVGRRNVLGFQFHPEKSQDNGLKLLENFCAWTGQC